MGIRSNKIKKVNKASDNKIIKREKSKNMETINLLEEVKLYITKEIFSFLEENIKLNIIKYNKKYQNLFEINIEYFRKKSGKLRIIEENGIGKEYTIDKNKLIFEGKFKNGKKNGKGKEYHKWSDKPTFEGSYLNDKRHGKGREYEYGFLRFDGNYLNGKRHGKGIQYGSGGKIEFEGIYENGYLIEGKGYNWDGKLTFELRRNGKGKEYELMVL